MSDSTFAFAEDFTDQGHDNDHSYGILSDDNVFPPLSSVTTGFELVRDDVLFMGENTVWVSALSYAEAAESGGIPHKTISMCESRYVQPPASYWQHVPKSRTRVICEEEYDDGDETMETVYYNAKSLSTGKASVQGTIGMQKPKITASTRAYYRNSDKSRRKLADSSSDIASEYTARIQEAKGLVDGCNKIMQHREPDGSQYSYKNQFHNRLKTKDWHTIWRRCVVRAYNNDPIIERLYDEFESYVNQHGLPLFQDGPSRLNSCNWKEYHHMKYLAFRRLCLLYSDIIDDIKGLDSNLSKKERAWITGSSVIPKESHLGSRATRAQCAYAILDKLHG
ncbi:hypothetical protein BJV82DRAFT_674385 [Fennellomyces sp. T-0311]|nr:hypothetical protein BJV82DRAFT_674385 [Fennellomyces sp. T-0311]